jgi:hypothetical protein
MVEIIHKLLLGLMLHQHLMNIDGEPMHKTVKKLEKELCSNLIAIPCPWGNTRAISELSFKTSWCSPSTIVVPTYHQPPLNQHIWPSQ